MFTFEKCTYDELQVIRYEADLLLSGWTMLEKEYIDETEKIYDEDGKMVALINYYLIWIWTILWMISLLGLQKAKRSGYQRKSMEIAFGVSSE